MRPVIALLIAAVLLSGIYVYTDFANRVRPEPVEYVADYSGSKYSVRINRTFDCVGNAEFGLPTSLELIFKQKKILDREDKVPSSEVIEVELPNVEIGRNIIEIVANLPSSFAIDFSEPPSDNSDPFATQAEAMQVILIRDGNVIAEQTFWVEPGLDSISGSLFFEVSDNLESEVIR